VVCKIAFEGLELGAKFAVPDKLVLVAVHTKTKSQIDKEAREEDRELRRERRSDWRHPVAIKYGW
jgi:hypothetical protein